jgi:hypothetical protein
MIGQTKSNPRRIVRGYGLRNTVSPGCGDAHPVMAALDMAVMRRRNHRLLVLVLVPTPPVSTTILLSVLLSTSLK